MPHDHPAALAYCVANSLPRWKQLKHRGWILWEAVVLAVVAVVCALAGAVGAVEAAVAVVCRPKVCRACGVLKKGHRCPLVKPD